MNIELPNSGVNKNPQPTSFYQQCNHLIQTIWSLSNHHEINKGMENGYDFGRVLFPLGTENVEGYVYDPVTVLWEFCKLGSPLCAIMNLFKDNVKINIIEVEPDMNIGMTLKKRQKSIFLFIKNCKDTLKMTDAELFSITDVFRDDTNYFIKVVKALNKVIDKLKEKEGLPKELIPLPESLGITELNVNESTDYRAEQIKELLTTERSYVRDLELMRTYKNEAVFKRIISKDKALKLFANIDDLVDFQRRFLVGLESILASPVKEQRIGNWFLAHEESFAVYNIYCANQESASEMAVNEADRYTDSWSKVYIKFYNLPEGSQVDLNSQIPSYLIRPVQRICKYPLLLERLYKYDKKENHPYADELFEGLEAIKRVVNGINETKRKDENFKKVAELNLAVEDWKDFQINQFGELLFSEQFDVSTSEGGERILNFYLFERILVALKEGGKPKKSKIDQKMRVPLILKKNFTTFTTFIINVENISVLDQMKFQFKIVFRNSDDIISIVLKTKKGIDLVDKWVKKLNEIIEKNRAQKQSAFNNNTQLISSYSYNPEYAKQYMYDSSEEEFTEEQLNMKKMAEANNIMMAQNGSYTSSFVNPPQRPMHYRSPSYTRNDSQEYNSNISYSFSSSSSGYYGAQNEPRNPQYDIYSDDNYYDNSLLDEYFDYDSEPEEDYRSDSLNSGSYNQYYSNGGAPAPQQYPPYTNNGQNYYSHSRSNSNQYSSQISRNSSYPDFTNSNYDQNRMNNAQYMHQRKMSNTPQRPGRERSLSRGHIPNPMKPSSSSGNIHGITNSMNNMNLNNGISQSYKSLNQITPPVTPIHTSHSTPLIAPLITQVPPLAQQNPNKANGQHKSFLPGMALGSKAKLKVHFKEDTFTLEAPSTALSYEELRRKIEKKLRICTSKAADLDFNRLIIRYKDELGHHVSINNDNDIIDAYETTFRSFIGKQSAGTMVIELFVH